MEKIGDKEDVFGYLRVIVRKVERPSGIEGRMECSYNSALLLKRP